MKRVLILGTYPAVEPRHGGQKRAAAIIEQYRLFGARVRYVGVYVSDNYTHHGQHDIFIKSAQSLRKMSKANDEFVGDVAVGHISVEDSDIYDKLVANVMQFNPDLIQIEQPYLLPFILKAQAAGIINSQAIVYSSHNIEYEMKDEMISALPEVNDRRREEIVEEIRKIEEEWANLADWVIAVTEEDAKKLKSMGAKKVIVARNGINPPATSDTGMKSLRRYYEKRDIAKSVLFVGSGHPPNWFGFLDTMSTGLGYLPHNTRVVVAGGVRWLMGDYLNSRPLYEKVCFYKRVEVLGVVSEDRLGAAVQIADVIILPITTGGGSNLKTAEAIASGKQVVATRYAMRGYEVYSNLPGINIASSPSEFREMVAKALDKGVPIRSQKQQELANGVLWKNILGGLKEVLSA